MINIYSNIQERKLYQNYLQAIASLSGLFSDSKIPFVHYRTAENIFCKTFKAENLSRADIAYDAKKNKLGIGLKTFILQSNSSREKIAEFNSQSQELGTLKTDKLKLVKKITELRNNRIIFANRTYDVEQGIYHCVTRQKNKISIFETDYEPINFQFIKNVKTTQASIFFEDNKTEYSFNFSKSTLYRKFYKPKKSITFDVEIIHEPYEIILKLFNEYTFPSEQLYQQVILPLYSTLNRKKGKIVPEKSGLNQWNAGGRKRNVGEVYIPIPKKIHKFNPTFFPNRDENFTLILPNNEKLSAKLCQDNRKALMTNPNKALSEWLLRKVLKLSPGQLLNYNHLKTIGVDSVKITKLNKNNYKIDFSKINSYENFENLQIQNSKILKN